MKIFLDTANIDDVETWIKTGLIDGITTNPSHISKEKQHPTDLIKTLAKLLGSKTISVEVTEQDTQKIYKQAHAIAQLANNIVVKIPCYLPYYPVIKQLISDGIAINATLVFTIPQALMMCKLGVAYISPFIGRLEDIASDTTLLLPALRTMINQYNFSTALLAASLRDINHFQSCIQAGADITTLPVALLAKIIEHPLTTAGMSQFNTDWKKLNITQFP